MLAWPRRWVRRIPPIQGLSQFGGFQFEVLDQSGGDIANLADVTAQLMGAAMGTGQVTGLYSSFTANDPQLVVDIDRDRARSLGLPIGEVTSALQVLMGSQYVSGVARRPASHVRYDSGDAPSVAANAACDWPNAIRHSRSVQGSTTTTMPSAQAVVKRAGGARRTSVSQSSGLTGHFFRLHLRPWCPGRGDNRQIL